MLTVLVCLVVVGGLLLWAFLPRIRQFLVDQMQQSEMQRFQSNPYGHFQVPEEYEGYLDVRDKVAPDAKERSLALWKWAMRLYPMARALDQERGDITRLYQSGMCSETSFTSFQAAERMVKAQIYEIQCEADDIHPGSGATVWREVEVHYLRALQARQRQAMEAHAKENAERNARNAVKNMQRLKEQEAQRERQAKEKAIRDAEKAAKELRRMADDEEQRAKNRPASGKKKKQAKRK